MAQRGLTTALRRAEVLATTYTTSRFATTPLGLVRRSFANISLPRLDGYRAVLGIDGEGWRHADMMEGRYIAVTKAVLADVARFERGIPIALKWQARWEGHSARAANRVVAASEYAARQVVALYGVAREKVTVIPEPFDVIAWRRALPIVSRRPMVLAVGHMYARKNYQALLRAWPLIAREAKEAELVLVGTGPEYAMLRRIAAELPSVRMPGHVPLAVLQQLYASATVFCHPSRQENFGLSVVEAVSAGLQVVAKRIPALVESVGDLDAVELLDRLDPRTLADAVLRALHRIAGVTGRNELLAARFDPGAIGARWHDVIDS